MTALRSLLGCTALSAALGAQALSVSIQVQYGYAPCGQARGEMYAYASGGVLPYTFSWSNGATVSALSDLPAGSYTVTVTDNVGTQANASADVVFVSQYPTQTPVVETSYCVQGQSYAIYPYNDASSGNWFPFTFNGPQVLNQSISDDGSWWVMELDAGAGQYQIGYMDALGCPGDFTWNVPEAAVLPAITVSNIGGSCSDGAIGSATVHVPVEQTLNDLFCSVKRASGEEIWNSGCGDLGSAGSNEINIPFTSLEPGDYWVVLDVDEFCMWSMLPAFLATCADSIIFTIPDLGISCGEVIGTLFVDADGDCLLDADENRVPNTVIAIAPGSTYTSTNGIGWFGTDALPGATTFTEQHPILDQSCAGTVNVIAGTTQTLDVGMAPDAPLDAMVSMGGSPMRPGIAASYWIQARNLTDAATGTVTLTVQLDPVLNYIGANPAPTLVAGNTLSWTDPDFTMTNVFEQDGFYISVSLPPDILLVGTVLNSTATLATANTDADGANNVITVGTTVTASLDPNDKIAQTSTRQEEDIYLIDADEWIDYTIRFQNTGTDTAFNVVITDTLPATLDPTSLLVGAASHPMTWTVSGPGILRLAFTDILLPDSTTNEALSHGLVSFRIKPQLPLLPGAVIENTASIFFDFNDPVITAPSVLTAEFSTGVDGSPVVQPVSVYPNPASDRLFVNAGGGTIERIRVATMDGRTVSEHSVRGNSAILDTAQLSAGTYVLVAETSDGSMQRLHFTVIHP